MSTVAFVKPLKPMKKIAICASASGILAAPLFAASSLVPMATFGGGDGWRAPNEILAGDTAGTATGASYNYLGTGSLERGFAYNPTTRNLIAVSRSAAGNGIRILNGTTGVDVGALAQGSGIIAGGTFTTNMAAAAADGSIYVANLQTAAGGSPFNIYRWANESATPSVFFTAAVPGTVRLGDTLDVTGSGAGTTLAAGANGSVGYAIITSTGATAVTTWGAGVANGDFRLGITFGASALDVLGKETSDTLKVSTYSAVNGTLSQAVALTSLGEMAIDHITIMGNPYLATLDANSSTVRVYDFLNPTAPVLLNSMTTTSGALTANGNGVGQVRWGTVTGDSATLYAMATNQGLQALVFQVPEPASLSFLACGALFTLSRRSRKA